VTNRHRREAKLTKQTCDGNRGNNTDKGIPIVDVVHSVNLWYTPSVTESGSVGVGERHHYYVRNHNLDLEYSPPNELHGGKWRTEGLLGRHSRRVIQELSYHSNERECAILQGKGAILSELVMCGFCRFSLTVVRVNPKNTVANPITGLSRPPPESFFHWT
jgi:hypothetical protein